MPFDRVLAEYTPHKTSSCTRRRAVHCRCLASKAALVRSTRSPNRAGRFVPPRTSASTIPRSHRLASRRPACCAAVAVHGYSQGFLNHHDAARAQRLSREDHAREESVRKLRKSKVARASKRSNDREDPRACISIRSTSVTAPTAWRPTSQRYFGKSVARSQSGGSRHLAARPQGAARYNPVRYPPSAPIHAQHRDPTDAGRGQDQRGRPPAAARAYPLQLANKSVAERPRRTLWNGWTAARCAVRKALRAGLKVYTTLDLDAHSRRARTGATVLAIEAGRSDRNKHETLRALHAHREGDVEAHLSVSADAFSLRARATARCG